MSGYPDDMDAADGFKTTDTVLRIFWGIRFLSAVWGYRKTAVKALILMMVCPDVPLHSAHTCKLITHDAI